MALQPMTGFSFGDLIDAGLEADEKADGDWHKPDGAWHASSLGGCTRQAILARAGFGVDGTPRSGLMTFSMGHAIHDRVERWAKAYEAVEPRFKLVEVEVGGTRDWSVFNNDGVTRRTRLKAKPDMICSWEGRLSVFEIKSERSACPFCKKGGAAYWREKEAAELGYASPVKYEHWLQMTASAMVREPVLGPILEGRTLYVGKNDWLIQAVPVDVGDAIMRSNVVSRLQELERAWAGYVESGTLPKRISPADKSNAWRCDLRTPSERKGEFDPRGRYCPARSACMSAPV